MGMIVWRFSSSDAGCSPSFVAICMESHASCEANAKRQITSSLKASKGLRLAVTHVLGPETREVREVQQDEHIHTQLEHIDVAKHPSEANVFAG